MYPAMNNLWSDKCYPKFSRHVLSGQSDRGFVIFKKIEPLDISRMPDTISSILKKVETLDKKQRRTILLMMDCMGVKIIPHGDGSRVDLAACTIKQIRVLASFLDEISPVSFENRI